MSYQSSAGQNSAKLSMTKDIQVPRIRTQAGKELRGEILILLLCKENQSLRPLDLMHVLEQLLFASQWRCIR